MTTQVRKRGQDGSSVCCPGCTALEERIEELEAALGQQRAHAQAEGSFLRNFLGSFLGAAFAAPPPLESDAGSVGSVAKVPSRLVAGEVRRLVQAPVVVRNHVLEDRDILVGCAFTFLDIPDLGCGAALVCRCWSQLSKTNTLWQDLAQIRWPEDTAPLVRESRSCPDDPIDFWSHCQHQMRPSLAASRKVWESKLTVQKHPEAISLLDGKPEDVPTAAWLALRGKIKCDRETLAALTKVGAYWPPFLFRSYQGIILECYKYDGGDVKKVQGPLGKMKSARNGVDMSLMPKEESYKRARAIEAVEAVYLDKDKSLKKPCPEFWYENDFVLSLACQGPEANEYTIRKGMMTARDAAADITAPLVSGKSNI